jgi:hypothetical protein
MRLISNNVQLSSVMITEIEYKNDLEIFNITCSGGKKEEI